MVKTVVANGKTYDARKLTIDWFTNSNDIFFYMYGFNFNPHDYPGLYEWGRKYLHGKVWK